MLSTPTHLIGEVFSLIYRGAPGYEAHVTPDATVALSGDAGDFWLNALVIHQEAGAVSALHDAVETLRSRSLPGWCMHDERLAGQLAPVAEAHHLHDAGSVPFMVYRPEQQPSLPPANSDILVKQVADSAHLLEANRITAAAFESPLDAVNRVCRPLLLEAPGLEIFLGWRDGQAVSTVTTIRHGPVCGIWTMGTLPEQQRTGTGRALLTSVLRRHLERGATAFYLIAFEAGKRLYDQIGFRTESEIHSWIVPGLPSS